MRTKLLVFVGIPGSRADFVVGWLGKLPGFIESFWSFEPTTGQSLSVNQHTLTLNHPNDIDNFTQSHSFEFDADSSVTYATKVHEVSQECLDILCHNPAVKLIEIDLTDVDIKKIVWEGSIKTRGRQHRGKSSKGFEWVIDGFINTGHAITDQDRISELDRLLHSSLNNRFLKPQYYLDSNYDRVMYNDIFKPGGSRILTNMLGLTVEDVHHQYWDYMLPLAQTPNEVVLWGHTFRYSDYVK